MDRTLGCGPGEPSSILGGSTKWYVGENESMNIRKASNNDFDVLYALGKATPELRVSATEEFMEPDEFRHALTNHCGIFLA